MRLRIHLVFILCLLWKAGSVSGQQYLDKDSLEQALREVQNDTLKVQLYISLGQQYERIDPDSAILLYERALKISQEIHYTRGIISYYTNVTFVYNMLGKLDTSLLLNLQSVEVAREFGDKERLASCLNNVASSYFSMEKYDSAITYYLKSIDILEEIGYISKLSITYSNLVSLYDAIEDYQKAIEYSGKAIQLARENGDTWQLLAALNNSSGPLVRTGRYNEAINLLKEGIDISRELGDGFTLNSMLANLGDVYLRLNRFEEALEFYREGLVLAEQVKDSKGMINHTRGFAYCYLNQGIFEQAMTYAKQSLGLAIEYNLPAQVQIGYLLVSDIYLARNNMPEYNRFRYKSDSIDEVINRDKLRKNLQDLEEKYQARLREQQIVSLENESTVQKLKYRSALFILLSIAGVMFTVIVISLLMLRNNRQRRLILEKEGEIRQSRINELELEKQNIASEAVLKGQDEERTRLARDLHDGLGGMLSGIKFSFNHMRENLIMTPDNQLAFERGIDMLDSSIRELREIAHNMMPESLLNFGLDSALNDLCKNITASGALAVDYQSFELGNLSTHQTITITIYRIVQELLNNIRKHASARRAFVQLIYREEKLVIIVEDDGIGLSVEDLDRATGIGWRNIRSRVDYIKGQIDIQSEKGKGTTVNIELTL